MNNNEIKTFITIWSGHFVSRIGAALMRFALLIWVYEQTNNATTVALLGFFSFLPVMLVSPFAGVWIDRLDRRKIMLYARLCSALITLALLPLIMRGNLQIWHLYLVNVLVGTTEAFLVPAYTTVTTVLLSKEHFTRANGLRSVAEFGADVLAPFLGGIFLIWLGIGGVITINFATLLLALISLIIVRVPHIKTLDSRSTNERGRNFWKELRFGFHYVRQRPGLLKLMYIFTGFNFVDAVTFYSIFSIMILARSGENQMALASVQSVLGVAGVLGGLAVSVWGGPKRKIHVVLIGGAISFAFGNILLAMGRNVITWSVAVFVAAFFVPFIMSSNQAIWQERVKPSVQGRVFSTFDMMRQSLIPIGFLLGGFLSDSWFEPSMMPDGHLAPIFGNLVGTGPGAGMALLFFVSALLGSIICLSGYLFPEVRNVENDTSEYDLNAQSVVIA